MFGKFFVLCLIVAGSCSAVQAEGPAGMVLYFQSGAEVFLLLADHRETDRGWAGYGGGPDEGESAAETAARETEEETRGYFLREDLLARIKDQEPVIDNDFALYFAEIPFVPAQLVTNNPLPSDDESYVERGPYAWIPYSEVQPYLKGPVEPEEKHPIEERLLPGKRYTSWYWQVWLGSVRRAVETNSIPWEEAASPDLSEKGSLDP